MHIDLYKRWYLAGGSDALFLPLFVFTSFFFLLLFFTLHSSRFLDSFHILHILRGPT